MADALVIGAGVIGLTSAICLAESGMDVRIRAAAPPQETTSRAASAMWGSSFAGPADDVRRWAVQSLDDLRALADEPGTGVRIARGMLAARSTEEGPPPFLFPGVEVVRRDDAAAGLRGRLRDRRARSSTCRATSTTCSRASRRPAASSRCARCPRCPSGGRGAGGRQLQRRRRAGAGARPAVRSVRGQHVVVENPGPGGVLHGGAARRAGRAGSPMATTSCSAAAPTRTTGASSPIRALAEEIVRRCAAIEPRLADARVIEHRVGLRPARPDVRVEEVAAGRLALRAQLRPRRHRAWRWPGAARATSRSIVARA